jgi:hypothetical protein
MRQDEVLSLVMAISTDAFQMVELSSSLRVGDPFQFNFRPADNKVSQGLQ